MYRFLVAAAVASAAALASVPAPGAGGDIKSVRSLGIKGTGGELSVVDGEVVMAPRRLDYSWKIKGTEKGYLVYQDYTWNGKTGRMVDYSGPRYLSCDRRGRVFLAKEPGEGSYWGMPLPPSRKDPDYDDGGESRPGPIRCKFGFLAIDTKNPLEREINGQKLRLYRVRVVEQEGEIAYRFVVSTG
jgi:hypothetical protein